MIVATVPLPGLVQFNDEPEGDGVSAAQKNAALTNSDAICQALGPKNSLCCVESTVGFQAGSTAPPPTLAHKKRRPESLRLCYLIDFVELTVLSR